MYSLLKVGLVLYAAFFIVGSLLAPGFAHGHYFSQADWLYDLFSASCQQQATRSFWLFGYPVAICARCLGVYFGFVVLGIFWILNRLAVSQKIMFFLLCLAISEKIMEWYWWEGTNELRFISGILLGAGLLVALVLLFEKIRRLLFRVFSKSAIA